MNRIILIAIAVAGSVLSASAETYTNFAIGLSPMYPTSESEQIERGVKKFVLDAPMGSRIRVDDTFDLHSVATFTVPVVRYDSPANRVRVLSPQFASLIRWFKEARTRSQTSGTSNNAVIRVPEYLDFLAANPDAGPRGILLIGTPFMTYPTEPTFSMIDDGEGPRVPSDGHLLAPLTASPYGCADRKSRLRGSQISWAYPGEQIWSNGLHKTLVTRFWTLFAKQQDAVLTAFTPDLATAFSAVSQPNRTAVAQYDLSAEDTKIEMRVARPRQVPTWLPQATTQGNTLTAASTSAQPTNAPAHSATPERTIPATQSSHSPAPPDLTQPIASTIDLGIMWESSDNGTDIDLYVRARSDGDELSFFKARTRDGTYVRDWTSPNNRTDFEWVKLNPGIRLGEIDAWVNLFKGRGPISGRVAIHFENQTFVGSFALSAASGNRGQNAAGRGHDPHWTHLDLKQIITQAR